MIELEDTFDAEIDNFRKGMPFDAVTVMERIRLRSVNYESNPSAESLDLLTHELEKSRTALYYYISTNEREKTAMQAAYIANSTRRAVAEKEADAWQMRCVVIAAVVVVWLAFRSMSWLMPVLRSYL